MRILPFIIILFCAALIFKSSSLFEKHLFSPSNLSDFKIDKIYNKSNNIQKTEIEYLAETTIEKESSSKPKLAPSSYPKSDFVTECTNQQPKYSDIEIKILENLSNRRKEIQEKESALNDKEKLLDITIDQVEKKIKQLKDLESSVLNLLNQYNEKEDMKILSLVKIYQAMKPEDAAKIFNGLDMDILLQVINRMKETNAALIIANMNPEKAKDLTIKIAQQKKLK